MEYVSYVITGIFGVIIALLEIRGQREQKSCMAEQQRSESRAARRAEESRLSMELMAASCKLGVVTAKAVTHQHVNGDVEEAMEAAAEAQAQYDAFLRRVAAAQTVKL